MAARITIGAVLLVLLAWPAAAATLELQDFSAKDEAKKVLFTIRLSAAAEAQVISNYQSNFVAVSVAKLRFPRQLLKADHPPADEATLQFYRFVRFQQTESEGQIRLYLGKLATPADVQVVQLDDRIEIELIKPLWKQGEASSVEPAAGTAAADTAAAGTAAADTSAASNPDSAAAVDPATAADSGFREPETADAVQPDDGFIPDEPAVEPADAGEPEPGGIETSPAADQAAPADSAAPETAAGGESYGQTQFDEVFGTAPDEPQSTSAEPVADSAAPAESSPVLDMAPQPSYRQFDLSRVPVSQVEITGLPFDEALMRLVADSGFNVVVGAGVESGEVNLSFTHKDLSLKSALDLLCIAYDLAYTVEDDAIVVRHK